MKLSPLLLARSLASAAFSFFGLTTCAQRFDPVPAVLGQSRVVRAYTSSTAFSSLSSIPALQ